MKILSRLEKIAYLETGPQAKVAKYILEHDDYADLSVAEIIEHCQVTTPTPTRLAQKIGLSGFSELKYALQNEAIQNDLQRRTLANNNIMNHVHTLMKSLEFSYTSVDEAVVNELIHDLDGMQRIVMVTQGTNQYIADDFAFKLKRLNFEVRSSTDLHEKYIDVQNLNANSVCIGISNSGTSSETMRFLKVAKRKKAKVYIITSNLELNLPFIDRYILVKSNEPIRQTFNLATRLAVSSVLDFMYLKLLNLNYDVNIEKLNETKIRNLEYEEYFDSDI